MMKIEPNPDNIKIILVNPTDDKNIGSTARAIKTMGMRTLVVVSKRKINMNRARITAVHAEDILKDCLILPRLETALTDASLIAGITRRLGKFRKYFALSPEQLGKKIAKNRGGNICVLFGNEKHGLCDRELKLCHLAVTIPSSPLFPSLNLSHAVQIIAYHIYRALRPQRRILHIPIMKTRIDAIARSLTSLLKQAGLFKMAAYDDIGVFFQDITARAELSGSEAERVESIIEQLSGILSAKSKLNSAAPHKPKEKQI
jgi:TrmH family RNA methyltransferase